MSYVSALTSRERVWAQELAKLRAKQRYARERWIVLDVCANEMRERIKKSMESRGACFERYEELQLRRVRTRKMKSVTRNSKFAITAPTAIKGAERFKKLKRYTGHKSGGAT